MWLCSLLGEVATLRHVSNFGAPANESDAEPGQHYFTQSPASSQNLRDLNVRLADQDLVLKTASGIFSPDHVDTGTKVLLRKVPAPPTSGHLLDVGAGWGPIALTLALRSPQATVWAVDVNERALDLVRKNARLAGVENVRALTPDEVPSDIQFSTIWSNPPVRIGKQELRALVSGWLERLTEDGVAWLVIQRHLGGDSLHRWLDEQGWNVQRAGSAKGFRVLRVQH